MGDQNTFWYSVVDGHCHLQCVETAQKYHHLLRYQSFVILERVNVDDENPFEQGAPLEQDLKLYGYIDAEVCETPKADVSAKTQLVVDNIGHWVRRASEEFGESVRSGTDESVKRQTRLFLSSIFLRTVWEVSLFVNL